MQRSPPVIAALVMLAFTSTGCGDSGASTPAPPPPDDTPKALQIGNGELGTGKTSGPESCDQVNSADVACSTAPVPVAGGVIFAQTSAGGAHTCGATTTGDAYCWGFNGNGQVGDGTTTNRLTPARVVLE